jgi:hypothetical protein
MTESTSLLLLEMQQKFRMQILWYELPKVLARLLNKLYVIQNQFGGFMVKVFVSILEIKGSNLTKGVYGQ